MKIQISWGWKVVLAYCGFVLMMVVLVAMSMVQKIDLVAVDYYAQELVYQDRIDKRKRALALDSPLVWRIAGDAIEIQFPESSGALSGAVYFYCPADNRKDQQVAIRAGADRIQKIPLTLLQSGRYKMQVDWQSGTETYWVESVLTI